MIFFSHREERGGEGTGRGCLTQLWRVWCSVCCLSCGTAGKQCQQSLHAFSVSCVFGAEPLIVPSIWHMEQRQGTFSLHKYLSHHRRLIITEERLRRYQLIFIVNWAKSALSKRETTKTFPIAFSSTVLSFPSHLCLSFSFKLGKLFFFSYFCLGALVISGW